MFRLDAESLRGEAPVDSGPGRAKLMSQVLTAMWINTKPEAMKLTTFLDIARRHRSDVFWRSALLLAAMMIAVAVVKAGELRPAGKPLVGLDRSFRAAFFQRSKIAATANAEKTAASNQKLDFNRDIKPILEAHCYLCHGGEKAQAQLRLDSEAAILQGGVSGRVIVPGSGEGSLLVQRLLGWNSRPRMPLGADPLPKKEIDLIRAWIDQGPPGFASAAASQPALESEASHPQAATESPLFSTKIRPILAARCYQCHGPDVQQNGLRLDSLAAALKGSASGKVIVPGDSKKSPMILRLLGLNRPQMPYGGPPLSHDQSDLIQKWIDQGASGPDSTEPVIMASKGLKHWAYMKPTRPKLPKVKNASWCRNPIDYFVLARLEKEGIPPSPEADRETLLRRASLDLIGLPPTVQEVDAFVLDRSPDAYEKAVDRLLASPHYGERWARPWLDLARYADTNGWEADHPRTAWKYRDWVINALNQNMSFKEFTIEQIAGDMLPNPTTDQLIATGFHRNTMLNEEGGTDPVELLWITLVDRVNTTASVWLGTTLACAECHNHKFDPFTQKDYYRFLAFFDNADYKIEPENRWWVLEPQLGLPTPEQEANSKELKAAVSKLETVLNTPTPELEAAQAKWELEMKAAEANWTVLRPNHFSSAGGATLSLLADQSVLAGGKNPEADTYLVEARTDRTGITGVRLEVLSDSSLPQSGPGRDADGNFFLSGFELEAAPVDRPEAMEKVVFKEAAANESQSGYDAGKLIRKDLSLEGWAIDSTPSSVPTARFAVLVPEKPFGFDHGTLLMIRLKHEMRRTSRNIGRFRLAVTTMADPLIVTHVPAHLRRALDVPVAQRTQKQKDEAAALYRSIGPPLQPTRDQVAKLKKSLKDLGIVTTLIMGERHNFERPYTYVRTRGSFMSPTEKVYADVPAVLGPLPPDQMPNRLGLANWLVSEDNPLTARVTVNRFWEQIFGGSIVETSEDFGTQGDLPTHPELLDWLATEFMRQNWSMKKTLRLIVTSATYRQSARVTSELKERDPYNKLLARGPRFRVEAEMVRDIALAAAGLLSLKIGGPSVFPYQPEGLWDRPYSDEKWVESKGEDRYRRGIYTFIRRTVLYPSLVTFDAPSREFCTVRRVRTNTPLQALATLNDPAFFEASQALAKRMMLDGGPNPAARVAYGFRRCVSRRPTEPEVGRVLGFYQAELSRYQKDPKAASEVVKGYSSPSLSITEQAAWTMVARVLLNMDETITKE